jgi:hypothetical protein
VLDLRLTSHCTYEISVVVASGSCTVVVVDSVESLQAVSVVPLIIEAAS